MKRITFELHDDLHKKLKLLCYTESLSIGHILRQCVSDFCDKHDAHLIELIDKRSKWLVDSWCGVNSPLRLIRLGSLMSDSVIRWGHISLKGNNWKMTCVKLCPFIG